MLTGKDFDHWVLGFEIFFGFMQTLEVKKRREGSCADLKTCPEQSVGAKSVTEHTAIELTGTDRPGLLSEVSAILTTMNCNVNAAEIWTHNMRVACMVYVTDEETKGPIKNAKKLDRIKELLLQVMGGDDDRKGAKTDFPAGVTHTERRLHQLMFADRDYEDCDQMSRNMGGQNRPIITVQNCNERGYSVVTVQCRDRPKLLFDTVCTLTDMQFVVFHASIDSSTTNAVQVCILQLCNGSYS